MTEQPQPKKRMSKGCMVGMIVAGVLLIMFIAAAVTCWLKKDDLAKFGAVTLLDGVKSTLAQEPVAGLDTAQFNALADAFKLKLNESELDYEKYQVFFQSIQTIPSDEKIDEDEAWIIVDGMIEYFPDLEDYRPEPMIQESFDSESMDESEDSVEESTE
ncbi:MAG: hypothetical protein P1R58_04375 [bacterium]|nr:hypothetical protein [bacterium]